MKYDYQTVSRTILGDLHTPVSTYLKVRDIFPQSALMESSDYHGSENNRSFIGLCPVASVSIDHGVAVFCLPDGTREEHPVTKNTMRKMRYAISSTAFTWKENTATIAVCTVTHLSMPYAILRTSP